MSPTSSIIIGVLSGVIASALVAVCASIVRRIVLPWYRDHVYSGVEIGGSWVNAMDVGLGIRQELKADLAQHGQTVEGTVTVTKMRADPAFSEIRTLKLDGELQDRLLAAKMIPADRTRIGNVVLLLEVVGGGRHMKGGVVWVDAATGEVRYGPVDWWREGTPIIVVQADESEGAGDEQAAV